MVSPNPETVNREKNAAPHCFLPRLWITALLCSFVCLFAPPVLFASPGLSYKVIFEGISDGKLLSEMKGIADSIELKDKAPVSVGLLRRRAERDVKRLVQLLKARGYYAAKVRADIDADVDPVRVTFQVKAGSEYILESFDLTVITPGLPRPEEMPEARELGLVLDTPFRARLVVDAEKALLQWFKARGFPFPRVVDKRVLVTHARQSVAVVFQFDPGPRALFGPTKITGLKTVNEDFIRGRIPWQDRDRFNADLFPELQKRLTALGLFSTVRVITAEALEENGRLPVTVAVTERNHRSVGAGVRYQTDEGPGAEVSWEHRNFLRKGERLTLKGEISGFILAAGGILRKPHFLRDDQTLDLSLRFADERPDAYTSRNVKSAFLIDRKITPEITAGGGLAFKSSKVEQLGVQDRFNLLSMPFQFGWDTSDDLINPGRGGRLGLEIAPFQDISATELRFLKAEARYRRYFRLSKERDVVLAGKITLGAMDGAETDEIPADERFYAGGGGSIRGYAFQSVGPLVNGEPVGGRSLLELSAELRVMLSQRLGLVAFTDGGSVFEDILSGSNDGLRWGTGLGIRYFTPVGPLRLDVGIPLNRREGVDDSFQIYLSLGHAF